MKTITLTQSGTYQYTLNKEGDELSILGRFSLSGNDRLNLNLTIIHQAPNTKARTSIKATVDGHANAVIHGKVIVTKTATNTNSFLEERVLLLSPHATAEAVPDLEIDTNEVACSHAATVGEIDESQLFYLTSRGIPKQTAKHLIGTAFLTDTISSKHTNLKE
jgi:Fe-S cluster assembly protein SufD